MYKTKEKNRFLHHTHRPHGSTCKNTLDLSKGRVAGYILIDYVSLKSLWEDLLNKH